MAGKTNNSACAVAIQAAAGAFTTPTLPADLMPISQLRPNFQSVQIANDEYTGSIVNNADTVAGSRKSFSFNVKIRPPVGALPAANEFLFGRLLQALKFTEVRSATAIPAAPEALGAGSTTKIAKLGSTASSTAGFYNGYPLLLSDNGADYKRQLTQVMDYSADKDAALPETLPSAPAANYQVPPFLGYFRSITSTDPIILSMQFWLDGIRYDLRDVRPTSAQLVFPTSTRDAAAFPELQITVEGILAEYEDEATPAIPALGAVPLFRDGDMWLSGVSIGGSSFTIDLGLGSENPPNPNQPDGSDPAEIVSSTARISQTRQRYPKAVLDTLALAEGQAYHSFWAQYGNGPGTMVQVAAPKVRLAHPSPDLGGGLINEAGDLLVDAIDRGIAIVFPQAVS